MSNPKIDKSTGAVLDAATLGEAIKAIEALPQDYECDPGRGDAVELLRRMLANAAERQETDTFLVMRGIREDQPLPRRAEIAFLPDPARSDRAITCTLRGGVLRVDGSRGLVVKPRMSNSLTIELEG